MRTWTASEARAKFYELIRRAEAGELQEVTRRGDKTFYLMRYEDWQSLKKGIVPKSLRSELKRRPSGTDIPSAENIAGLAECGESVSSFFISKGRMIKPGKKC